MIQVNPKDLSSSPKIQKMEDVELVLRFFALKDGRYKLLKKGFREFMTSSLVEMNGLDDLIIKRKASEFRRYMRFIHEHAGPFAFAKWRVEDDGVRKRMSTFNAAVYDAVAVGLSEVFSMDDLREKSEAVSDALEGYQSLFASRDFFGSVSGSVNDAAKVIYRIDAMSQYLRR